MYENYSCYYANDNNMMLQQYIIDRMCVILHV
jgi:hypothetical protein